MEKPPSISQALDITCRCDLTPLGVAVFVRPLQPTGTLAAERRNTTTSYTKPPEGGLRAGEWLGGVQRVAVGNENLGMRES